MTDNSASNKRQRNDDSDVPIAKRINRLHIRPSNESLDGASYLNSTSPQRNDAFNHVDLAAGADECDPFASASYPEQMQNGHRFHGTIPDPSHMPGSASTGLNQSIASLPCSTSTGNEQHFSNLQNQCMAYEPELGPAENPYYYSINGQLYYAHMERIARNQNVGIQP